MINPMLARTPTWAVSIALLLALLGLALAIHLVQSSLISDSGKGEEAVMASTAGDGLVSKPSNHSVVWISYNSPAYLQQRHNTRPELLANIAIVETLAARAAE